MAVRRFPVAPRARSARVRPPVAPRVRTPALDRRRARLARERRAREPRAGRTTSAARRVRFLPAFQLPLLPRVARRAPRAGARRCSCPPPSAIPAIGLGDFRPGVPRRARRHVQLARRARHDPGRHRQPGRAGRRGRRRIGRPGRDRSGAVPAASSTCTGPFAIYIGRIDENKGCAELFAYFQRYAAAFPRGLDLVLVGSAIMPVPAHPRIHHLGFLTTRTSSTRSPPPIC